MEYEINDDIIIFHIEHPKREDPSCTYISTSGLKLNEKELTLICDALSRQARGRNEKSQRNMLYQFFKPFLGHCIAKAATLPNSSDNWRLFILYFFQYYMTDTVWSQASAHTRMCNWNTLVSGILDFWIAEEIIPLDVIIPNIKIKNIQSDSINKPILGDSLSEPAPSQTCPQKLVVNLDFSLSDADYLDTIQRACSTKIDLIKSVCLKHWDDLMRDGETGKKFASSVDVQNIDVFDQLRRDERSGRGTPASLASYSHPSGYMWGVGLVRQWLLMGSSRDCISIHTIRASPHFPKKILHAKGYIELEGITAMPAEAFSMLTAKSQFYRFVGVLSSVDVAAACCLLTIEHPEFTSESLQNAKILNVNGKFNLILTDEEKTSILSLDKPRACQHKYATLTPLSQKIVKEILEWTEPVRQILRKSGDKGWRYLFLGCQLGGRLGPIEAPTRLLNNENKGYSLCRFYKPLSDAGLNQGTFDYRRIRTTMGVLRWFETGSIIEMSRRLGNSTQIVIEHYLPKTLLHAWNTRLIRRFQNTLIILAAYEEEYLLDVTDFSNFADLQHFIAQLILEYPDDSSPLAREVTLRLKQNLECKTGNEIVGAFGVLSLRLSITSLSYLYAFSDFALKRLSETELREVDIHTRLAPIQFVDLAQMIRHACEDDEVCTDLRELLELPKLKLIHDHAVTQQPIISQKLAYMSIGMQWET